MPTMQIHPQHYLKSYGWKKINEDASELQKQGWKPTKMSKDIEGVVWVHDRYPNHQFILYDDGRAEHIVQGNVIASMPHKRVAQYLAGYQRY
jgi:hypothetical protein